MSSSPVVGTREVAYRLFAAEFDDASLSFSESDEERAPNYVISPTGARLNRTFVAGVLTEVERVNDEVLRGRVADPTGAFVTYAGQYQPEPMGFLDQTTPPAFVALTGKARTYQPDDSDVVFTSIRPESINEVDADVRDRWIVSAAESTLHRIAVFDEALSMPYRGEQLQTALEARGVESSLASGIPLAIDHYGTTRSYLEAVRTLAVQALEMVSGDRDQVETLSLAPAEGDDVALGSLPELDLSPADSSEVETAVAEVSEAEPAGDVQEEPVADAAPEPSSEPDSESPAGETDVADEAPEAAAPTASAQGQSESESVAEETTADTQSVTESEPEPDTTPEAETDAGAESDPTSESEPVVESEPESATSSSESGGLGDFTDEADASAAEESDSLGDFEDDVADTEPSDDSLGDFTDTEPESTSETVEAESATADAADSVEATGSEDLDPNGMYEMDAEERAEVEAEFGTEFTTGTDVDPAGEADMDVPAADDLDAEVESEPEPEPAVEAEADADDEGEADVDDDDGVSAEDIDLESAVVDAMESLDDGDGATRDDVLAAVVDDYGADPDAVSDAIQDALLGGRCYEPQEDVLKAI